MKRIKFWPFYLLLILGATLANAQQKKYVLVIHGGAGTILKKNITPEKEKAYVAALTKALTEGYAVIQSGKSSLDAVETSIRILENSPLFNAGKGAVFTHDGKNEFGCLHYEW